MPNWNFGHAPLPRYSPEVDDQIQHQEMLTTVQILMKASIFQEISFCYKNSKAYLDKAAN